MEELRAGELADRWVRHYEDAPWEPNSAEQAQPRAAMVQACVALVPPPTASAALPLKDQPPVIAAIAESTLYRVRLSAVERPEAECLCTPLAGLERSLSVTHYLAEGGFGIMRHDHWTFRLGGEDVVVFDTASRWRYSPEEAEEIFAYDLAEALGLSVQRAGYDL